MASYNDTNDEIECSGQESHVDDQDLSSSNVIENSNQNNLVIRSKNVPQKSVTKKSQRIYTCNKCGNQFTIKSNMYRHRKHWCKVIEQPCEPHKDNRYDQLLERITILEKKLTDSNAHQNQTNNPTLLRSVIITI
jgi:hypothetical protein